MSWKTRVFLQFIEFLIDTMRLIGIVYLLYFCGHLDAMPADMTFNPITLMKRLTWPNWKRPNNAKFNPDVVLNTVSVSLYFIEIWGLQFLLFRLALFNIVKKWLKTILYCYLIIAFVFKIKIQISQNYISSLIASTIVF